MNTRFIYRTHYQAVGLRLIDLALRVLSPLEPSNPKAAAERISIAASDEGIKFNAPAAAYLLGEMRELGLLNRDNAICDLGVPYYLLVKQQVPIAPNSRLLYYFCVFFNGDGAFLWSLLKSLTKERLTFASALNSSVFERLTGDVLSFYADHSSSAYDFARIQQQKDDVLRRPLAPKTRKHKMLFHLTALEELGLVNVDRDNTYKATKSGSRVLAQCQSLDDLERTATSERGFLDLGAEIYAVREQRVTLPDLVSVYRIFSSLGLKIVTIEQLRWALTLRASITVTTENVVGLLRQLRDDHPGAVHLFSYRTRAIDSVQIAASLLQDTNSVTMG